MDNTTLERAVIQITENFQSDQDQLSIGNLPLGITANGFDVVTGQLILTGTASIADYQTALQAITYQNTSNNPVATPRTIQLILNDGNEDSTPTNRQVIVTSVEDQPVNETPADQRTAENVPLVFSTSTGNSITIEDADIEEEELTINLSLNSGVLTLAAINDLTFLEGDGVDDRVLTFTGTLAAINTALEGLRFTPAAGFTGNARLTLTTDSPNSISEGSSQSSSTIDITVSRSAPTTIGGIQAGGLIPITGGTGATQLRATLILGKAGLVNEVGVVVVDDEVGRIDGIAPGEVGYVEAGLQRAITVFSVLGENSAPDLQFSRILTGFKGNDRLQFFLIQNGTIDSVLAGGSGTVFMNTSFNQGNPQLRLSDLASGRLELSFEDVRGGDDDFNDVVFSLELTDTPSPLGATLQGENQAELLDLRTITRNLNATITLQRSASFNNTIGLYVVDDAQGRIDSLAPGDTGYLDAVLQRYLRAIDFSLASNNTTQQQTVSLTGGAILSPFLVVNNTIASLLDTDLSNDPEVYFPFLAANSDGQDHIQLLGDNTFGFEDLPTGGDRDFNDLVMQVNLAIA